MGYVMPKRTKLKFTEIICQIKTSVHVDHKMIFLSLYKGLD